MLCADAQRAVIYRQYRIDVYMPGDGWLILKAVKKSVGYFLSELAEAGTAQAESSELKAQ